jgi:hypothetical protein
MIVAPITSPGRFPPFGPSGMRGAFHQRPDQSQECLVLWSVPILAEERCEFDIRALSARCGVGTVRDKHFVGLVITDEMPTITVGTVIQLSHMMRHTFLHRMPTAKHMGMTAAERQPAGIHRGITRRRKEVPPLAAIGKALEDMHQRRPCSGSRWSRSSIKNLLDRAREQGYIGNEFAAAP